MNINCYPIGETIDEGFYCDLQHIEVVDAGGQDIYVDKLWSGGDVFLCYFAFLFLAMLIAKWIFDFLLPKVIKIKRKQ